MNVPLVNLLGAALHSLPLPPRRHRATVLPDESVTTEYYGVHARPDLLRVLSFSHVLGLLAGHPPRQA